MINYRPPPARARRIRSAFAVPRMLTVLRLPVALLSVNAAAALCTFPAHSSSGHADTETPCEPGNPYVFSWPFLDGSDMQPRGGTTAGAPVAPATTPSAAWKALREPGLDRKERDRRAILAMAGPYRASFNFLETVGFTPGFEPARPYQSWATEYVYVIADQPDFISLQHIIVLFFDTDDGESEPMVVKHWRQDWRYQDRDLHVFTGDRRWQHRHLSAAAVRGKWSQAVYQVDDSPRYEAVGAWRHTDSYSVWESGETWRPLPRREFSVRDDYDVLVGTNRHTILPTGWVHEEDNLKIVLEDGDNGGGTGRALARETGINRYDRIEEHDWAAGDAYWQRTAPFWKVVRETWRDIYRRRDSFTLRASVDDTRLFEAMFRLADSTTANDFDAAEARAAVAGTLERYLEETP